MVLSVQVEGPVGGIGSGGLAVRCCYLRLGPCVSNSCTVYPPLRGSVQHEETCPLSAVSPRSPGAKASDQQVSDPGILLRSLALTSPFRSNRFCRRVRCVRGCCGEKRSSANALPMRGFRVSLTSVMGVGHTALTFSLSCWSVSAFSRSLACTRVTTMASAGSEWLVPTLGLISSLPRSGTSVPSNTDTDSVCESTAVIVNSIPSNCACTSARGYRVTSP